MARPRQGTDAYHDIRPVWEAAMLNSTISKTFTTDKEAIAVVQRLHALRLRWREEQGITYADKFEVRRDHNKVTIQMRQVEDVSTWISPEGPVDKQQVQNAMIQSDMLDLEREGIDTSLVKQQQIGTPFDPDAPLSVETC